mmetsp:Transcript_25879/g.59588  ORF Transcript_25879/g.59588 Transcript_25879/m.59588 type:complete len:1009 (-) Transcript_25879:34-3060(-)
MDDSFNASRHRSSSASIADTSAKVTNPASVVSNTTANPNDQAAAAAASLQLLLREDNLLMEHGLTESKNPDQVAFRYAAALLQEDDTSSSAKQRADLALQDVERKLALVESLGVKLSRTSPEAVAGHLLRLHGHHSPSGPDGGISEVDDGAGSGSTLQAVRERADRLERQSEVLENVAKRVEGSLQRGLDRMDTACTRLERVLNLSSTLKMILRAQFENSKLQNYDLEDLRDLTRAAASVSILEDLFKKPELQHKIAIVERLRPEATATAAAVRDAAGALLEKYYMEPTAVQQLGATLQVYFHLAELPVAVWKAVDFAHRKAEEATRGLWNPSTLSGLTEQARKQAKDSRMVAKKLIQLRLELAETWCEGISEATNSVRNLQRVLTRKTDPESRKVFIDVVAGNPVPIHYEQPKSKREFSLFALFWARFCRTLSEILNEVLEHDHGKLVDDVSAFYPSVRSVSKNLVGQLHESLPIAAYEESGAAPTAGILGGSLALDDSFLQLASAGAPTQMDNPQAAHSADSWTQTRETATASSSYAKAGAPSSALSSAIFQSSQWKVLTSNEEECSGLYPLQKAFLEACTERLCKPLQYMFPENIALDDDGVPVNSGLSLLPSKYDVQRFDENIREELSLADPKEGGGEFTAVTMIAECVVDMISQFCVRARNALSGSGDDNYLKADWTMTEALQHDRKVAAIMYTLQTYLKSGPEKTFVAPYRPSTSHEQEQAAQMCLAALQPALDEIDNMVAEVILNPLCRASNRRLADVMATMHLGVYVDSGDDDHSAFAQNRLAPIYHTIAENILSKFPPPYASVVAANISSYSIYTFVSNAALIRPLSETARLHITQDLADLELSLEQLVMKGGGSIHLNQIRNGKPYSELRSVRQMLFWNGLEQRSKSSQDIAKGLLRELWVRDLRPSTIIHFLFTYAPSLLSSPHHTKRVKPEEYAEKLVTLDGEVNHGEEDAWMVTMSCCDSYQQRATSAGATQDGDSRISQILLSLGPELLRRRRH